MTKRMLVFIPCLAVALAFAGCGTDGDGGSAKKALNPFASLDRDVMAEGLEAGYISTAATPDAIPLHQTRLAQDNQIVQSRQAFLSTPSQTQAMEGQIGVSTMAPRRDARLDMRYNPNLVTAKEESDGLITLTAGEQTSYLRKVEVGGKTFTAVVGADGSVSLGGENTFPKLVEGGRGVVLVSGSVVAVE